MSFYERAQESVLLRRLGERPERIIVVEGPRQTGKTTLVNQVLAHVDIPSRFVSADEPDSVSLPPLPRLGGRTSHDREQSAVPLFDSDDSRWLVWHWEQSRLDAATSERGFVLAIDEVQKIPNWSETVKGLWDADRRHDRSFHVILLGSAPLHMQSGLSESLAGRYETIRVTHWSLAEMSAAFDFDLPHYIYYGGYPASASMTGDHNRWLDFMSKKLVEPNIEKDILALQRVHKPALLKQLYDVGTAQSGQIFSYNKLVGQLNEAGNTTTLAHYLDLLSNAGLITGLSKYASTGYRRRRSSPKLNVLNTALMTSKSQFTLEQTKADRSFWGRLVETAVGAHLYNTATPALSVYYWRENNLEVDFVLTQGPNVLPIEVKSGSSGATTRGLEAFKQRFDVRSSILVGDGGISLAQFLSTPAAEWFEDL